MRKNEAKSAKQIVPPKEITLFLLGESGVEKSTFINAFVNYMTYEALDKATKGRLTCLIPGHFKLTDPESIEIKNVNFGNYDPDENTTDSTLSGTKRPKCYKIHNNQFVLNIIDTPGIGDTDGIDRDNRNMRNILDFISNYREINAICVLLKPNNARVDVVFKFCLYQLFSHFNKSAADNILFLFTNARSTHYAPGNTGPALKSLLNALKDNPPNIEIEFIKEKTFCLDNESFRYLAAKIATNLKFDSMSKDNYKASWIKPANECKRLIKYLKTLRPYNVHDTLALKVAKQDILLLTQPLADIVKKMLWTRHT